MNGAGLWLVGSGSMALAYSAVMDDLEVNYEVIGRGNESAENFETATGRTVWVGGVDRAVRELAVPDAAIVAVTVDQLADTTKTLLQSGVTKILLEKPAGLGAREVRSVVDAAGDASVVIAYNRRQYASVRAARQAIEEDGGVTSFAFEVTEWPHATEPIQLAESTRNRWFLAQSSHVVDLAFHLGGRPTDWQPWTSGGLTWHPESARFAGAGVTDLGVTFSYHGDWEGPGRWGLELLTRKRRLILQPLEELRTMSLGSLEVTTTSVDDDLDKRFKPGVHRQTSAFLDGDNSHACLLADHMENVRIYEMMAGYQ